MDLKRLCFLIAGFLLLGVAFVGIFVPGVPRTGSIVGASYCFSRSNKKLEAWLERTYFFGPFLRHYKNGDGIPTSLKIFSIAFMWAGMVASMWIVDATWMYIFLTGLGAVLTAHIATIRPKNKITKERGGIPVHCKVFTTALLWIGTGASLLLANILWLYISFGILGLILTAHIILLKPSNHRIQVHNI